jgi:hypothetical protein
MTVNCGGFSTIFDVEGARTVSLSQQELSQQLKQLLFILKCAQAPTPPRAEAMAITSPAILAGSGIFFFMFFYFLI